MSNRNDPVAWMWAQACDQMSLSAALRRQFFRPSDSRGVPATWEPPVDVYEDDRELVLVIAMPGVTPDRMQVTSEPGALVVRGVRPFPVTASGHRVRQLEIPYGVFERRIALPAGRLELGVPEVVQGCLILRIRKLEHTPS